MIIEIIGFSFEWVILHDNASNESVDQTSNHRPIQAQTIHNDDSENASWINYKCFILLLTTTTASVAVVSTSTKLWATEIS